MTGIPLVLATSAGGVELHVAELAQGLAGGLAAQSFDVLVAGPAKPASGRGFTFEHVEISDRPRPWADLKAVARLRSLMRGRDVVHAHGLRAGALAGLARLAIGRQRRPALVVTLHNALVTSAGSVPLVHRILETIVAHCARVVLVVSDDIAVAMRARGARDVRLAIVPAPPLPPASRTPEMVRRELDSPKGAALLVTVARLAPQKGLDVLVDAAALLHLDLKDILVVIAGDGPLHGPLTRQIQALGAPVRMLGRRDDIAGLIGAADLVVMPSRWEGQPLVAQEALRAGAALLATDAGGTAALVQDGAALVPPGDPEALATAIRGLLNDPAALADLRHRAHRRGLQLPGADESLQQVIALYTEVTHPA